MFEQKEAAVAMEKTQFAKSVMLLVTSSWFCLFAQEQTQTADSTNEGFCSLLGGIALGTVDDSRCIFFEPSTRGIHD